MKPLKNDRRKLMANKYPVTLLIKLDEAMSCLVQRSAKSFDSFLSKLQRYTLDAMGPLAWFLDQKKQGEKVDTVRVSLSLLDNASAHFNVERRCAVVKNLNKDLRSIADAEFPDSDPLLFGDDIGNMSRTKELKEDPVQGSIPKSQSRGELKSIISGKVESLLTKRAIC